MDQQNSAQPQPAAGQSAAEAPAQAAAPAPIDASTAPASAAPATEQPAANPSAPATTPASSAAPTTVTPPAAPTGTPTTGSPAPAKKSSAKALIIILVLLVLAVIGVVAYQLFMVKGNSMTQSSYKTTVSPTAAVPSPTVGAVKSGDAKVDQQSDAIDQNMQSLGTDVKNIDSGLQDQSENLNQ